MTENLYKYSSDEVIEEEMSKGTSQIARGNGNNRKLQDIAGICREIQEQLNGQVDDEYINKENISTKVRSFKLRDFIPRNSLLTDLTTDKNCRTIYHILIATFILLLVSNFLQDFLVDGKINLGLFPTRPVAGKLFTSIITWICIRISSYGLYFGYKLWAERRPQLATKLWDWMWLFGCIVTKLAWFALSWYSTVELPVGCRFAILMETMSLLLKNYAFVRTNAPRILANGKVGNSSAAHIPSFSTYVDFSFVPTFVYRDSYPRIPSIRWEIILNNMIKGLCLVWLYNVLLEQFVEPQYRQIGLVPIDRKEFIRSIFINIFPGLLIYAITLYGGIHLWMNTRAEVFHFADRHFYLDWWTSSSYEEYYQKWNIIVQDWLHEYVYRDLYEIVWPGNERFAEWSVFILSVLFHELILSLSIGFCYPVKLIIFLIFGIASLSLPGLKNRKAMGNCFILCTLLIRIGLEFTLYMMEYYARINCPMKEVSWMDYFVPISWSCYGII